MVLEDNRPLLDAFRRGDRSALAQVFLAYSDDVARQVRAARVAEHDVESIVQDVFVKAFAESARNSYDGLRPYGAWLNTITKHVVIDEIRKRRRVDLRAPEQMPTITADDDQAMMQEDAELAAVVEAWRQSLNVEEQALFAARFAESKSFPQAAKSLGWSEIRVRKQDTALRTRLLTTLRQHGFLQKAKVSIGQSLLSRKNTQKP